MAIQSLWKEIRMSTTDISILPSELFSKIFSLLHPEDMKSAALVCKSWEEILAGEPNLWTWAVVTFNTVGDLQKKLEVPRLGQIKNIRFKTTRFPGQPLHLEKLLQALLAFPTIKKICGTENWDLRSVEPSVLACVLGKLDELNISYHWSKSQLEHVLIAISKKEQPMKKLSVSTRDVDGLRPAVVAAAATNVKELELGYWCDVDQVKALLRQIVEKDGPLDKLKIGYGNSLHNIDPDLVGRALNRLEEVEVYYSRLSQDQVTAILKGVVKGESKLKTLWLVSLSLETEQGLDRKLVRMAEEKIGKFCK